jgi:hypothetical protein
MHLKVLISAVPIYIIFITYSYLTYFTTGLAIYDLKCETHKLLLLTTITILGLFLRPIFYYNTKFRRLDSASVFLRYILSWLQ